MGLWAICVSSEECRKSFAWSSTCSALWLLWSCESSLCILDTRPLSEVICKHFSPILSVVFSTLLIVSFDVQMFLILKSNFSLFSFCCLCFSGSI